MCNGCLVARIQGELALSALLRHCRSLELLNHTPDWGHPR